MRAKAVVFTTPGVVEVQEVTCPEPRPDDVVVALTHSWISTGTESSFLRGERIRGDTPWRDGDPWPFPVVPGYQKVGTVLRVGDRVDDLEVGQTVFAVASRVSGICDLFAEGAGHISPSVVPRSWVWRLPEGCDQVAFSGLVLAQVGYNCGSRPPVEIGGVAVVIGDGLVGHWAAQTLALRGARVAMLGRHSDRLARFDTAGGLHMVVDTGTQSPRAVIEKRFPDGIDVVVDTVGTIEALEELVPYLRRFGHIVSAGFYGVRDRLALQPLRDQEIGVDVVAGLEHRRMDATLRLVATGQLKTVPLITHHFPVDHAPEAWRMIMTHSEPYLGVVLDWADDLSGVL
ncbi:zinc-dependent alcohol dehydrogenase [Jiangella asiatica]|uniref:Zinc-binding alcohol dehydrogenase n=1 Tax=Jiangella asiatica TaxID=2530372 RepID=A0A4R5DAE0_9ACTN|nr:zinc-binding alcohol dehydrogenase [Jiangella asiatica]TDE10602.1 zinc-binding alcohol dehydrogenase [Jiangella asiatica]